LVYCLQYGRGITESGGSVSRHLPPISEYYAADERHSNKLGCAAVSFVSYCAKKSDKSWKRMRQFSKDDLRKWTSTYQGDPHSIWRAYYIAGGVLTYF
jgi:hypothetical protein